jgi:DNA ligase-1
MTIKPHLACDYDPAKLQFPIAGMPKIDGVRALNLFGKLTGRSMKAHKNKHVTALFSKPEFVGFDGELAVAEETHPDLCRLTSSAVGRISGEPAVTWWIFDLLDDITSMLAYGERYRLAKEKVEALGLPYVKIVPMRVLTSLEDLEDFEAECLEAGFEGVILRDLAGMHKSGRATVKVGAYMRIKRFIEEEALVLSIEEAMENTNEAKVNELGRTERSSHQDNMVPKGMIGNLICSMMKDVYDGDKLLFSQDQVVTVGPGAMPHVDRVALFQDQSKIVGQVIKFKFFPKGVKDKPRFPTFVTIRSAEDMS